MNIVHYNPWRVFDELQNQINSMANIGSKDNVEAVAHWTPAIDLRDEKDRFVLLADLPGVEPKDIEITTEDGELIIRGERSTQSEEEGEGYYRVERRHGNFYRRFKLPETADATSIRARSENGVLEISIPKLEQMQPRRIEVDS